MGLAKQQLNHDAPGAIREYRFSEIVYGQDPDLTVFSPAALPPQQHSIP